MSAAVRRTTMLRVLLIWLAGVLVIGLGGPAFAGKSAPPTSGPAPTATQIRFALHSTTGINVPSTRGSDNGTLLYVVQDLPFAVDLSFWGDDGTGTITELPLSTNKSTRVTIAGTAQHTSWYVDVPAGETSAPLGITPDTPANSVKLYGTAPGPKRTTVSGESTSFDVLIDSTKLTSIGGVISPGGCDATAADPVCAQLLEPRGGFTSNSLLSRGVCDGNVATACSGTMVQALADFAIDRADPATLIMKCDKTLCGGRAIQNNYLKVQLAPTDDPQQTRPCPAKGLVGANQEFCVDYVQSTRDNAGDTFLYLLFIEDAKVRFP